MTSATSVNRKANISNQSNAPLGLLKKLQDIKIGGDPRQTLRRGAQIALLRNLTTLIENGVSLPKALATLAADRSLRKHKHILVAISRAVKSGQSLSAAMKKFPLAFNAMLVNQIRVGEQSGTLNETLARVTAQIEQSANLKQAIAKKLTYPAVLVVAGIGSVTFMLLYVIPTFQEMYEESGATLPWITQALIDAGELLRNHGWTLLAGIVAAFLAVTASLKNQETRLWIDRFLLSIPILGDWFRNLAILQFADVLGNLMESGYTLVEALPQAGNAISNRYVRKKIQGLSSTIRRGERFSHALEHEGELFPPVVMQLVIVGEQTGRLATVTKQIRFHIRRDVETATNAMVAAIEPILTATLALVVGGILLAVYLPMFDMIGQVN
ncbi:MAG: type II secretion system F family protein [Pirellulaceae bacterium]